MKYKEILESRGFTSKYETLDLYNVKQWRLYYDETSYLILDQFSGEVMEYGIDCEQPYAANAKRKLYYGGPLCYYIELEGKYYGIKDEKSHVSPPLVKGVKLISSSDESSIHDENNIINNYAVSSLLKTKDVSTPLNIQRQAFGKNIDGTCSAVATCVILTYLNRTRSSWYVPNSDYSSENLVAVSSDTLYPKAEKLHQLLITSGMGTASYAERIAMSVLNYKQRYLLNTTVSVEWRLFRNDPTYITNQIDLNIPGMITTTLLTDGYDLHTMAVYGYKKYSDGTYDFLVHTGWYKSITSSTSGFIMPKIYIPSSYETYLYKFNI